MFPLAVGWDWQWKVNKTPILSQTNADQSPQPIAVVDGQHCRKVDELDSSKTIAEVANIGCAPGYWWCQYWYLWCQYWHWWSWYWWCRCNRLYGERLTNSTAAAAVRQQHCWLWCIRRDQTLHQAPSVLYYSGNTANTNTNTKSYIATRKATTKRQRSLCNAPVLKCFTCCKYIYSKFSYKYKYIQI